MDLKTILFNNNGFDYVSFLSYYTHTENAVNHFVAGLYVRNNFIFIIYIVTDNKIALLGRFK
jgi:hypothetical protein